MGNRNILKLLLSFLKIGLFTFGGGYAMIPLIQREMVEKHQWITSDELLEMVAISARWYVTGLWESGQEFWHLYVRH